MAHSLPGLCIIGNDISPGYTSHLSMMGLALARKQVNRNLLARQRFPQYTAVALLSLTALNLCAAVGGCYPGRLWVSQTFRYSRYAHC